VRGACLFEIEKYSVKTEEQHSDGNDEKQVGSVSEGVSVNPDPFGHPSRGFTNLVSVGEHVKLAAILAC
jgi:hypothetical protein